MWNEIVVMHDGEWTSGDTWIVRIQNVTSRDLASKMRKRVTYDVLEQRQIAVDTDNELTLFVES